MKRFTIYISSILAVIALLSSCAVKYTRPEVDADHLFRDTEIADSSFSITDLSWREFYSDTILCALIDSALVRNFDMKTALNRLEQSAAYFKQSKWAYAPILGANAGAQYGTSSIGGPELPYFTLGLSASWEIDIWGKLTKAKRAKYEQMLAAEDTRNAIQTQIVAEIANKYYTLVALDKQRIFAEETITVRQEYLQTVKSLKEAAQVNEVAVLQAEAQLTTVQGYLISIDRTIRETENAICLLLGIPCGAITRISDIRLEEIPFGIIRNGIPASLLSNRPDIMSAEHSLRSALHSYNSAVAAQYPSLTISGNISSDANQFNQWFAMPSSLLWSVAGGLFQPIFNGRALRTQKETAYQEYLIAETEFRRAVLTAGMEVSNALYAIDADKKQIELQYKQYAALDKAYEYSLELMINGYATYLDVLTAQEGAFNARINLIRNALDFVHDHIELYRALGGGWN